MTQTHSEVKDLIAKLQFLVDWIDARGLLSEGEGSFTFPDGDTWWSSGSVAPLDASGERGTCQVAGLTVGVHHGVTTQTLVCGICALYVWTGRLDVTDVRPLSPPVSGGAAQSQEWFVATCPHCRHTQTGSTNAGKP